MKRLAVTLAAVLFFNVVSIIPARAADGCGFSVEDAGCEVDHGDSGGNSNSGGNSGSGGPSPYTYNWSGYTTAQVEERVARECADGAICVDAALLSAKLRSCDPTNLIGVTYMTVLYNGSTVSGPTLQCWHENELPPEPPSPARVWDENSRALPIPSVQPAVPSQYLVGMPFTFTGDSYSEMQIAANDGICIAAATIRPVLWTWKVGNESTTSYARPATGAVSPQATSPGFSKRGKWPVVYSVRWAGRYTVSCDGVARFPNLDTGNGIDMGTRDVSVSTPPVVVSEAKSVLQ